MSALAAIHVGLKQLGIDEGDARELYARVTGKRSLREMSPPEREAVVGELRRLGFKPGSKAARRRLEGRFAPKLQALWIAAWNLGILRDRTDRALIAFVRRQTGIDHVRFLHEGEDAKRAIEALKGWMERFAGVDWSDSRYMMPWQRTAGARIAWAQWQKIGPDAEPAMRRAQFGRAVWDITGRRLEDMTQDRDWVPVMNAWGEAIRGRAAS